MAMQGSSSKSGSGSSRSGSRSKSGASRSNGRRSSGNSSKKGSRAKREQFEDYSIIDPKDIPDGPDVLVDVPVVTVDEISLEVEDLHAQVAVMAELRKLVHLSVGADARLGKVELKIEGVEAQASMVTLRVSGCREELPGGRLDGQTDLTIR
jgi:hypothetical protein